MKEVGILRVGQIPVKEHWETSLRELAYQSIKEAVNTAEVDKVDALYVGNMLAGELSGQEHIGALISDYCGLDSIEAVRIEAAAASGGAALHQGVMSIASGMHECVVVTGVEQMTDVLQETVSHGVSLAVDTEYELASGISLTSLFAMLTRRYVYEGKGTEKDLARFCINAHNNGVHNQYAMFRKPITVDKVLNSPVVVDPIRMLECPPVCDGSASVVLVAADTYDAPVRITGSAVATDTIGLDNRKDVLTFDSVRKSTKRALHRASKSVKDIDFYEVHDLFPVAAALSLEAAGFAKKGEGALLARNNDIGLTGKIPVTTMGGCKSRGNPVGASGVYQAVEAYLQLTQQAGKNQIDCDVGMIQCIGGTAATAITHIMEV